MATQLRRLPRPRRPRRTNSELFAIYEGYLIETRDDTGEEDQRAARWRLVDWIKAHPNEQTAIKSADAIVRAYDDARRPPLMQGVLFPDEVWFITGPEKRTRKPYVSLEKFTAWIEIEREDDRRHIAAMAAKEDKYARYSAEWRPGELMPAVEKRLLAQATAAQQQAAPASAAPAPRPRRKRT